MFIMLPMWWIEMNIKQYSIFKEPIASSLFIASEWKNLTSILHEVADNKDDAGSRRRSLSEGRRKRSRHLYLRDERRGAISINLSVLDVTHCTDCRDSSCSQQQWRVSWRHNWCGEIRHLWCCCGCCCCCLASALVSRRGMFGLLSPFPPKDRAFPQKSNKHHISNCYV